MKTIETNNSNYILGQNIARIRKQTGLSQADMEDYGISRAYYGRIELGFHSLTIEKLLLISRAFGVPLSNLFLDENGNEIL